MAANAPVDLKALSADELRSFFSNRGYPTYRGNQLFRWLYAHAAGDFEEMTDLPAELRRQLAEISFIDRIDVLERFESKDGTVKTLHAVRSGAFIESVLIPDFDADGNAVRITACVSSQVGCAMACAFCATGQMGFGQHLTSGEIYDQVWQANELSLDRFGKRLTNIVFMGMGEPMLNFRAVCDSIEKITSEDGLAMAPRRITVSTVGLARQIRRFADEETGSNLAVSLHAPTDEKRSAIMPVNRNARTDLSALREAVRYFVRKADRAVTYEYCLFDGFNDSVEDASALAEICNWAASKVNLIRYNAVEGSTFRRSRETTLNAFVQELVRRGVRVTVRKSRGQDIDAACGQLANRSTPGGRP